MRYKELFKTVIIVNFSKNTNSPFMNALYRIAIALTLSLFSGKLISKILTQNSLPTDIPDEVLMTLVLIPAFFLSGLSLMTIYSNSQLQKHDSFDNLVKLMPLPKYMRWLVAVLPGMIVLLIISCFSFMILIPLSSILEIQYYKVIAFWLIGIFSGFGFVLQNIIESVLFKSIAFMMVNAMSFYLLEKVFTASTNEIKNTYLLLINSIYLLFLVLFFKSIYSMNKIRIGNSKSVEKQIIPSILPANLWLIVKVWRNKRTRFTILQSLTISILVSSYIVIKNKVFSDPYIILIFAAMLSAMIASEIRGIIRRYLAPEIILISGVKGIVKSESVTLVSINLLVGLPLLFSVHGQVSNSLLFLLYYLVIQLFSSIGGLLASTILVPANNETGSQFFSVTLAISLIYIVPKLVKFSEYLPDKQIIYWLLSAIVIYVLVYIIELIRKRRYGHV